MKNTRSILISLCIALIGVMIVFSYVSNLKKTILEMATPIPIVFTAKDVPVGTILDESYLELRKIPKRYVQPGAVEDISSALNRSVVVPVPKDSQILGTTFMSADTVGVSAKIPKGMRAFSIAVSDVTAVAELIQPQDNVDIMVTVETGSLKGEQNVREEVTTVTVLQNIPVLAVNQTISRLKLIENIAIQQSVKGNVYSSGETSRDKRQALRTLTLAVTPENMQKLNLAQEIGTLSVALRSQWDKGEPADLKPLNAQQLLGIEKRIVPRSPPPWVEIRGAEQLLRYE